MGQLKSYLPQSFPSLSLSTGGAKFQQGSLPGLGLVRTAKAIYDFSVDGGAISTITIAAKNNAIIPNNAVIFGGFALPTTAPVGASATLAVGTSAGSSANSLKTATAITSFTLNAVVALIPIFTAATAFKMTAAGSITITIATTALTAGVVEIVLFYFHAAN